MHAGMLTDPMTGTGYIGDYRENYICLWSYVKKDCLAITADSRTACIF